MKQVRILLVAVLALLAQDASAIDPLLQSKLVRSMYMNVLKRPAGQNDVAAYWSALDPQSNSQRYDLAQAFLTSSERRGLLIEESYRTMLRRSSDPSGKAIWMSQNILDMMTLLIEFGSSQEYYSINGNSPTGFVTALYRDILGRSPDPAGLSIWVSRLTSGAYSRRSVVSGFVKSSEYAGNVARSMYRFLLRREPSAAEVSSVSAALLSEGDFAVSRSILSSVEYMNNLVVNFNLQGISHLVIQIGFSSALAYRYYLIGTSAIPWQSNRRVCFYDRYDGDRLAFCSNPELENIPQLGPYLGNGFIVDPAFDAYVNRVAPSNPPVNRLQGIRINAYQNLILQDRLQGRYQ